MTAMTVGELKTNFSEVLELVQSGETVQVLYGRAKKPVAKIIPVHEADTLPKRQIGILKDKAKFTIASDFKLMSTEEFLGLE